MTFGELAHRPVENKLAAPLLLVQVLQVSQGRAQCVHRSLALRCRLCSLGTVAQPRSRAQPPRLRVV